MRSGLTFPELTRIIKRKNCENNLSTQTGSINLCKNFTASNKQTVKCSLKCKYVICENSRDSGRLDWFPREMTFEERAQKFPTDEVSLLRSG